MSALQSDRRSTVQYRGRQILATLIDGLTQPNRTDALVRYGTSYTVVGDISGPSFFLRLGLSWEPWLTRLIDRYATDVCIDVGAHIGHHTLRMAATPGVRRVYALEPNRIIFEALVRNCQLRDNADSDSDRIRALRIGAGAETQTAQLDVYTVSSRSRVSGLASGLSWAGRSEVRARDWVPIARLDDTVAATERVSFVKIDVEGGETDVLRGMRRILEWHAPAIVFEDYNGHAGQYLLSEHPSYRVRRIRGDNYLALARSWDRQDRRPKQIGRAPYGEEPRPCGTPTTSWAGPAL